MAWIPLFLIGIVTFWATWTFGLVIGLAAGFGTFVLLAIGLSALVRFLGDADEALTIERRGM